MSGTQPYVPPSILPEPLFDGQKFVDFYKVVWVYSKKNDCWLREGVVDAIPVADGTTTGLLPKEYKYMLDSIPEKGGGFAIITKPLLSKRSVNNPDGVLFGDIKLVSESLDIQCVLSDGSLIGDACKQVGFHEYDEQPPGFDLNLSESFLNTFCVEVPGGPGPQGLDGLEGDPGEDGTGDGPVGLRGESGKDATEEYKLTGVKIYDVDDIYDTAVVKLELDAPAGKLFVTKSRMALPDDENTPADQLIALQIAREVTFNDDWDYTINKINCRYNDDFDVVNPIIAFYPENFVADGKAAYPLVKARLSDLINDMIGFYKGKLDEIATEYDKQIEEFIKAKDVEARKVLDELGDRLAECENITYLEYCVSINGTCNTKTTDTGGGGTTPTDPECKSFITLTGCETPDSSTCSTLAQVTLNASNSPVLSFPAPGPITCTQTAHDCLGCQQPAYYKQKFTPFLSALQQAAASAYIVYDKTPIKFSDSSMEYPIGTYVFSYLSGAFRQERRNDYEKMFGTDGLFINGAFQDFWIGNDGNGSIANAVDISMWPWSLYQDTFHSTKGVEDLPKSQMQNGNSDAWINRYMSGYELYSNLLKLNFPFLVTETGVEVGFAPKSYKSLIPSDYFNSHKFDLGYESCVEQTIEPVQMQIYRYANKPLPRVDYAGLTSDQINMENKIQWIKFPGVSGSHSTAEAVQSGYINGTLSGRSVVIKTQEPGFFFMRVKTAFSVVSPLGIFSMPPLTPQGANGNSFGNQLPPADCTYNNIVTRWNNRIPFLNARPFATGQAQFKVVSVECKAASSSSASSDSSSQ